MTDTIARRRIVHVTNCNDCSFRSHSMDGEYCGHPSAPVSLFINMQKLHTYPKSAPPKKCPLNKGVYQVTYQLAPKR